MRVNQRVFSERMDMLDSIQIPNCPAQLKVVAENIMNMACKPGYSVGDYNKITELDKLLTWDYWMEYDNLRLQNGNSLTGLREWFTSKSTPEDLISRARRWLVEHNYVFCKQDVVERAYEAGNKFSKSMKR